MTPEIAEKTHTYLDILRKRYKEGTGGGVAKPLEPLDTTTETSSSSSSTTTKNVEFAVETEHPTSHFRPTEPETTQRADVKIVKPKYGDFIPPKSDLEEKERIVRNNLPPSSEETLETDSVIHDITGTTVYVVGVICIIPAAGLVAWIVRYVVKRRVLPNSENGSETGLNCPISDEDMMQVNNNNKGSLQVPPPQAVVALPIAPEKRKSVIGQDEDSMDETQYAAQVYVEKIFEQAERGRRPSGALNILLEGNHFASNFLPPLK